ncbi:hypothetical protein DdX_10341 [Ditylenchus destructor]|uniref:Uncharacterized protein n=1 Tax=Ditylenchus destructor TaxID=166010 RepID=A0AAD4N168_9BILA|nr:hypothetical protein DdX_10341 [Ditylenchus destructor]
MQSSDMDTGKESADDMMSNMSMSIQDENENKRVTNKDHSINDWDTDEDNRKNTQLNADTVAGSIAESICKIFLLCPDDVRQEAQSIANASNCDELNNASALKISDELDRMKALLQVNEPAIEDMQVGRCGLVSTQANVEDVNSSFQNGDVQHLVISDNDSIMSLQIQRDLCSVTEMDDLGSENECEYTISSYLNTNGESSAFDEE